MAKALNDAPEIRIVLTGAEGDVIASLIDLDDPFGMPGAEGHGASPDEAVADLLTTVMFNEAYDVSCGPCEVSLGTDMTSAGARIAAHRHWDAAGHPAQLLASIDGWLE